ncbi:MAG: hypothetical protein LBT30_03710 [Clostridiales bacterium]|jgi:predicted DNA-binding transcriptional regulator YafY|nr:hypothetical protein [Clostridiales bacterium]
MWAVMLDMLIELMTKDKLTTKYFSQKHEKSQRTIMRYLDKMRDNKIPLLTVRGRDGGFMLSNSVDIKQIFFSDDEISGIVASVRTCLPPNQASIIENKLSLLSKKNKDTAD